MSHFEVNSTLAKLAYLKDYRNVDTIREATRTMILLNRVLLHDKTLITMNLDPENPEAPTAHKLMTNQDAQTEFNDLIRNFFKRHILSLKSRIDSLPSNDLSKQYRDSNDEDILFLEFNNLIISEDSEECNALELLSNVFNKLSERIDEIKQCKAEMSFSVIFDFCKIYPDDDENISIFTTDSDDSDPQSYLQGKQYQKKIKAEKLKDVFKRALVDIKRKGRIDTGDRNLDKFLGFFIKEDPKKIVLLVDNFLSLVQTIQTKSNPNCKLTLDESNEDNDSVSDAQKSEIGQEEKEKLINLKLQAIEEVIKRGEKIKRKREENRKRK